MRSFLSLDLPDSCRDLLVQRISGLRAGRVVPWENLHLTLCFLGDAPEDRLEDLHAALEPLRLSAPMLRFGGLDWFGPGSGRMLAMSVEPVPELMALQAELEAVARHAGLHPERRRFRPHVTLLRFGRRIPEREVARVQAFLSAPPPGTMPEIRPLSFSLQASTLTEQGARYAPLAVYPLTRDV